MKTLAVLFFIMIALCAINAHAKSGHSHTATHTVKVHKMHIPKPKKVKM